MANSADNKVNASTQSDFASPATIAAMLNVIENRKIETDLFKNVTIVMAANPSGRIGA